MNDERREVERAEIAEIRSAAAECNQELIEDIEGLARDLKDERTRSAKLVEAAARALRFGFVTTEKGGVLICVASELRKALAEYEASK